MTGGGGLCRKTYKILKIMIDTSHRTHKFSLLVLLMDIDRSVNYIIDDMNGYIEKKDAKFLLELMKGTLI